MGKDKDPTFKEEMDPWLRVIDAGSTDANLAVPEPHLLAAVQFVEVEVTASDASADGRPSKWVAKQERNNTRSGNRTFSRAYAASTTFSYGLTIPLEFGPPWSGNPNRCRGLRTRVSFAGGTASGPSGVRPRQG